MNSEEASEVEKHLKNLSNTVQFATEMLEERWNNWDIQVVELEKYEVLGAFLARQITITRSFCDTAQMWSDEIAPIILRALVENIISFKWLINDPTDRVRKFVMHAVGKEKLKAEKMKLRLEESGGDIENDEYLKSLYTWINFHRYEFLTTVDVGSWSGISVRSMAIEGDCKDLYDEVYDPFSDCAHSTWGHIGKHNVRMSENPLHKFLRTPYIPERVISGDYPDLAIKYLSQIFEAYDEVFEHVKSDKTIYEHFLSLYEENEE